MRRSILVVEDDVYFAGILRDYLEYVGYEVTVAQDGQEGLESFEERRPTMVVTDVLMPRRNGLELSAAIKAQAPDLPVLLMSAVYKDAAAVAANLRQCGADDFIIKPFSMSELRDKLAALRSVGLEDQPGDGGLEVVLYEPGLALPREGSVEPGFLAHLMLGIRAAAHTGVLSLRDNGRSKDIVFLQGRPVWADGTEHADRLGTMLLEQGTLHREQFEVAVRAMEQEGLDFGSALTERGFLSATDLYAQLRALVLRRVVLGFNWSVGEWTLGSVFPRQSSSFEVAPLVAIFRGLLAHGDLAALRAEIDGRRERYVIPARRFATDWGELKSDHDLSGLGPFLNGTRTVSQLRAFEVVGPDLLNVALWVLFRAGSIGFGEAPASDLTLEDSIVLPPRFGGDRSVIDVAERVIRDYLRHWQKDYFAIYGLTQDCDDAELDAALEQPVLEWKPDGLPSNLPSELRNKAEALHAWVSQARETLVDSRERGSYRARLDEGLTGFYRKVEKPGVAEASMFFQLGKGFIRARNYGEAEGAFERAAQRVPGSGEYLAYLGFAIYRRAGGTNAAADEARAKLREALGLDPHSAMAWFFLGVVERDQRDYAAAREALERSVAYDPSFEPAARSLSQVRDLLAGAGGPLR
jgi:CheY-like chemotaxis protein